MDLIIRNVAIPTFPARQDIGVRDGRIVALAPHLDTHGDEEEDGSDCMAFGGFVESHIHLDKAYILDRCQNRDGSLKSAIATTQAAKSAFTTDDVQMRADRVIKAAIGCGTMAMQTFVEVDEYVGLRSLDALRILRDEYSDFIDLRICAFAQDGLTQFADGRRLLDHALRQGANTVGGCPYTDPDPREHVRQVMRLAARYDCDVDFHVDFDVEPEGSILPFVIEQTLAMGYQGRVSVGHATKLSVMQPDRLQPILSGMLRADILLSALPATDLFLMGGVMAPLLQYHHMGGRCTLGTNNVVNPFTPFGDVNLLRMGNLFANMERLYQNEDMAWIFDMLTVIPAGALRVAGLPELGGSADIVLLEAPDPATAVRELRPVRTGWKRGRRTFRNHGVELVTGRVAAHGKRRTFCAQ